MHTQSPTRCVALPSGSGGRQGNRPTAAWPLPTRVPPVLRALAMRGPGIPQPTPCHLMKQNASELFFIFKLFLSIHKLILPSLIFSPSLVSSVLPASALGVRLSQRFSRRGGNHCCRSIGCRAMPRRLEVPAAALRARWVLSGL